MSQVCEDRGTDSEESMQKKYITGEWTHIFREGAGDTICRILLAPDEERLVQLQLLSGGVWQWPTRLEFEDLEDSLKNANPEVFEDPLCCGLSYTEDQPAWVTA